ncbi:MAG TPA: hypothetical protein DCZ13_11950 [Porticoccaceae bacterium]|nr:hypothetical protein [Porticoccaceae bacterium]
MSALTHGLTDCLFIVPADDTARPPQIATGPDSTVRAQWLEPSGTQIVNGKRLLLVRFWRDLPSVQEVVGVLALNGREGWEIVGVMDPINGEHPKPPSMIMAVPYVSPVIATPAQYDDEDNEISPATYRPAFAGKPADFDGIGWFGAPTAESRNVPRGWV